MSNIITIGDIHGYAKWRDIETDNNETTTLLSGENSPKQLLLINNQLVTKLIKFFD